MDQGIKAVYQSGCILVWYLLYCAQCRHGSLATLYHINFNDPVPFEYHQLLHIVHCTIMFLYLILHVQSHLLLSP